MKIRGLPELKFLAGAVLGCACIVFVNPASAQAIICPAGYGYSPGYGCVPVAPGYAAVYGPPVRTYAPPVYDTFGINFGFGGGRGHYDPRHDGHGHDDHGGHDGRH